jgi:DNA polymerase-3 subunit gamma/tau
MRPTAVAAAPRRDEQPAVERQQVTADTPMLARFEDVVALAGAKRDLQLKTALERDVRLVRFEQGRIEISPTEHASATLATDLSRRLAEWTGQRWLVTLGRSTEATIHEKRTADRAQLETDARADPVVAAVMRQFPGAEIVDIRVRPKADTIMEPPPALPSPDEAEDN